MSRCLADSGQGPASLGSQLASLGLRSQVGSAVFSGCAQGLERQQPAVTAFPLLCLMDLVEGGGCV